MKRRRPPGLVIAYMQARLPAKRARPVLERQRLRLRDFALEYGIRVSMWYMRAKGLSPLPTVEQLIEEGKVYALIATDWDKTRACVGHWPDIGKLCAEHRVRRIYLKEGVDFSYHGERHFAEGWEFPVTR